jgi:hypothetical protein
MHNNSNQDYWEHEKFASTCHIQFWYDGEVVAVYICGHVQGGTQDMLSKKTKKNNHHDQSISKITIEVLENKIGQREGYRTISSRTKNDRGFE